MFSLLWKWKEMIYLLEIVVGESAVAFTLSAFHLFSLHSFPCIDAYKIVSFTHLETHKFHVFYHTSRSLHIFLKSSFHRLQPHNHKLSFIHLVLHNTCKVLYRFQGSFNLQMSMKPISHLPSLSFRWDLHSAIWGKK